MKQKEKIKRIGTTCQKTCKGLWKIFVTIFVLMSVFYGLVWIPTQQLKNSEERLQIATATFTLNSELANLSIAKIQNSCQIIAQNALNDHLQNNDEDLTNEQQQQLWEQFVVNCLFAEGIQQQEPEQN